MTSHDCCLRTSSTSGQETSKFVVRSTPVSLVCLGPRESRQKRAFIFLLFFRSTTSMTHSTHTTYKTLAISIPSPISISWMSWDYKILSWTSLAKGTRGFSRNLVRLEIKKQVPPAQVFFWQQDPCSGISGSRYECRRWSPLALALWRKFEM